MKKIGKKFLIVGLSIIMAITLTFSSSVSAGTFDWYEDEMALWESGFIKSYSLDENDNVESFTINGKTVYIPEDGRSELLTSMIINAKENLQFVTMALSTSPGSNGYLLKGSYFWCGIIPSEHLWDLLPKFLTGRMPIPLSLLTQGGYWYILWWDYPGWWSTITYPIAPNVVYNDGQIVFPSLTDDFIPDNIELWYDLPSDADISSAQPDLHFGDDQNIH